MAQPADARLQLETARLTALYGRRAVVKDVSILFPTHTVTALIGPSGCGKTTFLRCLNRMHELSEGGWITGNVLLDGEDIYDPGVDAIRLRRRIGMVFQRPTPFPTMSIYDNVAAGLRVNGGRPRASPITRPSSIWVTSSRSGAPKSCSPNRRKSRPRRTLRGGSDERRSGANSPASPRRAPGDRPSRAGRHAHSRRPGLQLLVRCDPGVVRCHGRHSAACRDRPDRAVGLRQEHLPALGE